MIDPSTLSDRDLLIMLVTKVDTIGTTQADQEGRLRVLETAVPPNLDSRLLALEASDQRTGGLGEFARWLVPVVAVFLAAFFTHYYG